MLIVEKLRVEICKWLSIISTEIVLKMPNNRLSQNLAYAFFPDANEYPYFVFNIDHQAKDGKLKKIRLEVCSTDQINEPVSKWLHQTFIFALTKAFIASANSSICKKYSLMIPVGFLLHMPPNSRMSKNSPKRVGQR